MTSLPRKAPPNIDTVDELVARELFDKEFAALKKELEAQDYKTWQIVIGVALAFILAVGVVIGDAIISRSTYIEQTTIITREVGAQSSELNNLKNDIQNLRIRNPYLK